MNYRLKGIEVAGFRGFNDIQYCSLDNPLVLLYAPNGHGKSSLCEAIESAIYGNNTRRTRGERDIQKGNLSILFVTGIIQRIQKLTLRFISTTIVTT